MNSEKPETSGAKGAGVEAVARTPTVAVIIPTKDRPEFLEEAITSALEQSHVPSEIIVVDDASAVPVDCVRLQGRFGEKVRVIRNQESRGLAYSRNLGVENASAEHVIHLDDDDLLATGAIAQCLAALREFPDAELVMFAVEGFGPNAEYFNRVQPEGVERVKKLAEGVEASPGIWLFDQKLFGALLRLVPSAFQRVMTSKRNWLNVSELRWRVYRLNPTIPDDATAKLALGGPLRDSEWARYAALVCKKIVLVDRPLYLARCAGQGYSSVPSNRLAHMRQGLDILRHLMRGAESLPELGKWKAPISNHLSDAYFDAAYQHYQLGHRFDALRLLREGMSYRFKLKQLRLVIRLALPRRKSVVG